MRVQRSFPLENNMSNNKRQRHWRMRADISGSVNSHTLSSTEKASGIFRRLQGLKIFQKEEYRTVLTDLVTAAEQGVQTFEDRLEALYNFCDYHRIWLGP